MPSGGHVHQPQRAAPGKKPRGGGAGLVDHATAELLSSLGHVIVARVGDKSKGRTVDPESASVSIPTPESSSPGSVTVRSRELAGGSVLAHESKAEEPSSTWLSSVDEAGMADAEWAEHVQRTLRRVRANLGVTPPRGNIGQGDSASHGESKTEAMLPSSLPALSSLLPSSRYEPRRGEDSHSHGPLAERKQHGSDDEQQQDPDSEDPWGGSLSSAFPPRPSDPTRVPVQNVDEPRNVRRARIAAVTAAEFGGSLEDILSNPVPASAQAEERTDDAGAGTVESHHARRVALLAPTAADFGGSLGDVLASRPARRRGQSGPTAHAVSVPTAALSSQSRERARISAPTIADFGGSLEDVLVRHQPHDRRGIRVADEEPIPEWVLAESARAARVTSGEVAMPLEVAFPPRRVAPQRRTATDGHRHHLAGAGERLSRGARHGGGHGPRITSRSAPAFDGPLEAAFPPQARRGIESSTVAYDGQHPRVGTGHGRDATVARPRSIGRTGDDGRQAGPGGEHIRRHTWEDDPLPALQASRDGSHRAALAAAVAQDRDRRAEGGAGERVRAPAPRRRDRPARPRERPTDRQRRDRQVRRDAARLRERRQLVREIQERLDAGEGAAALYDRLLALDDVGTVPRVVAEASHASAMRTVVFKADSSAEAEECAICLNEFEDGENLKKLSCEHHFHGNCIAEWLKHSTKCPLCRRDV